MRNWENKYKAMIIYKITNLLNKKVYIGQTINDLRRRVGRRQLNIHRYNEHLRKAVKKYGHDNFRIDVLEHCCKVEQLNKRERYWIKFYDSTNFHKGYNMDSCGNGGFHKSEDTKKKLSIKCSGWHHTKETKRKITDSQLGEKHWAYGKKFSKQHIQNLRKSHLGNKQSKKTKEKIRKFMKKRKITWGDKISKAKTKHYFCTIKECKRKHAGRGMCQIHYNKWRKKYGEKNALLKTALDLMRQKVCVHFTI